MKVAFATQDLKRVDAHFGWARNIAIYEVTADDYRFVEAVQFAEEQEDGNEDKLAVRIDAIRDCAIVHVAAIGGSGAARVVAAQVHPLKIAQPTLITDLIARLQGVLRGVPPPWLRKALMKGEERTLDFADEV